MPVDADLLAVDRRKPRISENHFTLLKWAGTDWNSEGMESDPLEI